MENELGGGPMLPFAALLPLTALSLFILIVQLRRAEGAAMRFALSAIWIRYVTALYHAFTFPPVLGSVSINAMITGVVVAGGMCCIPGRLFLLRWMVPFYLLTASLVLSALMTNTFGTSVTALLKCAYLIVLTIAIYKAALVNGVQRTIVAIVWVLGPLLLLAAASLALGVVKGSDEDGSVSYIGGYVHEAAWSILMSALFLAVAFARLRATGLRFFLLAASVIGVGIANYRTTMLAIAPFAMFEMVFNPLLRLVPVQRVLVGCAAVILVLFSSLFIVDNLGARFADFTALINNPPDITDLAGLSYSEARLLSGRIGIWAIYIDAYNNSTGLQHVFGFGPDAWRGRMFVYAHNSFVSALYETGIVGLLCLLLLIFSMFALAWRAREERARLLVGHTSFLICNLATLPLWQLEGNIEYAILCGLTFAFSLQTSSATVRHRSPAPVQRPKLRLPSPAV